MVNIHTNHPSGFNEACVSELRRLEPFVCSLTRKLVCGAFEKNSKQFPYWPASKYLAESASRGLYFWHKEFPAILGTSVYDSLVSFPIETRPAWVKKLPIVAGLGIDVSYLFHPQEETEKYLFKGSAKLCALLNVIISNTDYIMDEAGESEWVSRHLLDPGFENLISIGSDTGSAFTQTVKEKYFVLFTIIKCYCDELISCKNIKGKDWIWDALSNCMNILMVAQSDVSKRPYGPNEHVEEILEKVFQKSAYPFKAMYLMSLFFRDTDKEAGLTEAKKLTGTIGALLSLVDDTADLVPDLIHRQWNSLTAPVVANSGEDFCKRCGSSICPYHVWERFSDSGVFHSVGEKIYTLMEESLETLSGRAGKKEIETALFAWINSWLQCWGKEGNL